MDKVSKGLVSVIIPCYNHGNYLTEAVNSVLDSTYSPIEIIIVDDGSTDNSDEVGLNLKKLNPNVKYYRQENKGPSAARNQGISKSGGEYILPLDADDKISELYIEKAVEVLKLNDDVKLVYCNAEFFGLKTGRWKLAEFSIRKLALRNMIFSCAMYRKSDYDKSGGYNNELIYGHEDWEFWISLLNGGGHVYKLKDLTGFYYRIHDNSRRRTTARKFKSHAIEIINRKHSLFLQKYLNGPIRTPKEFTIPVNNILKITRLVTNFLFW
jgi:glycosyltransferase involved in cell wall biosynthesis